MRRRTCLLSILALTPAAFAGVYLRPVIMPPAVVNQPISAPPLEISVTGECAQPGTHTRVTGGRLPDGIELDGMGRFTGSPRAAGRFVFVVEAANSCSSARQIYEISVTGAPIVALDTTRLEFTARAGEPAPLARSFRVGATWADLGYAIVIPDNAPWLTARPRTGRTPPKGTALTADVVSVFVSPQGLAPGEYSATLRIAAWPAPSSPEIAVVLRVLPGAAKP
jgi:hypothetical protein